MAQMYSLQDHRIVQQSVHDIEKMRKEAEAGLATALSADLRNLSGKEIRKLRDNIVLFDQTLTLCAPETLSLIERDFVENPEGGMDAAAMRVLERLMAARRVTFAIVTDA